MFKFLYNRQAALLFFFAIAAVVIGIDLWTKAIAVAKLQFQGNFYPVIDGLFQFRLAYNKGAAFSFLYHAGGWQRWFFAAIALIMSVVLAIWLTRIAGKKQIESLGIALILGGAIGNLYDRLTLGYVVDFIDFYYQGHHFPAFNVADMGITCGAALLIFDSIFLAKGASANNQEGHA